MNKLKELRAKKETTLASMQEFLDAAPDGILTDDAQASFDALKAESEVIDKNIKNIEDVLEAQAAKEKESMERPAPAGAASQPSKSPARMIVPAEAKRWAGRLKAFKGQDAAENAYKAGQWLAAAFGNETSKLWCKDHGVSINAVHQGGVNATGGYLVPEMFSSAIIELVLEYGVFRANAGNIPMTTDTLLVPRRSGGLTAYFVGEGSVITDSTKSWDQVKLITKDLGVTTRISNQLISDAIIAVMDNLASEIALQFATKEDQCGFIGDGTSTYGGIVGVIERLIQVHSSTNLKGGTMTKGVLRYDAGYALSNVAIGDITNLMALLPTYARRNAKWHCTPFFYYSCMLPLLAGAGGVTMAEYVAGPSGLRFLGYPVVFNEVMETTAAADVMWLLFGDLAMAAKFGDRQQMALASSDSASIGGYSVFERNEIALRGTERFDINVHDVGVKATSAGPIVGLIAHTG